MKFLIDSGSEISVVPLTHAEKLDPSFRIFYAANGSNIKTYGYRNITLKLNLSRKIKWHFTVADVTHPIVGADLLLHHRLLLDFSDRKLIDRRNHTVIAAIADVPSLGLTSTDKNSPFWEILQSYPSRLSDTPAATVKHNTEHFIDTKGPPVTASARRLSPEKLQTVKQEFEALQQLGLVRPSRSNYASPIRMVRKKNGKWRICRDYKRLSSVTTPD